MKRWRKQKAAQQTKRKKRSAASTDSGASGGSLGGMRRFTQGLFGASKKKSSTLDIVLNVALVLIALVFVLTRRC